MSIEELLDVMPIHSVADRLPAGMPLISTSSFPCPTSHDFACRPGRRWKYSNTRRDLAAHRGVLFLDEFPEFGTRQPMEDKVVTISRTKELLMFSANFQLIAGYESLFVWILWRFSKALYLCTGNGYKISKTNFRSVVDRFDIHIEVPRVDYEKLSNNRVEEYLRRSANVCRRHVIFSSSVSQITDHPILFVIPICVLGRSGSIAWWGERSEADMGGVLPVDM